MGVDFDVVPSRFAEQLDDSRLAQDVAAELSLGKALDVAHTYPSHIVIGSDTIVTIDGTQLEKPHSADEAKKMLRLLSGTSHTTTTGLAVVWLERGVQFVTTDTTFLFFKPFDEAAVDAYIATGDFADKAGAYGIQSGAAPLIDYVVGYPTTVVGLPTHLLAPLLTELGVAARAVVLKLPISLRAA